MMGFDSVSMGRFEVELGADHIQLRRDMERAKADLGGNFAEMQAMARSVQQTLGLVGGSLSVAGLLAFSKELINVKRQAESLQTILNFASGGRAPEEMDYLRRVTHDLGLEFQSTASSYAKFQAAARGTALEGQGARTVFEAVSKAAAVMGLSANETEGALLALNQMISKGTVSSEELRGQLGERLPGAFQIAARSMGVTTAELGKLLEQGLVPTSEFLPKFAKQLEQEVGASAEAAANRTEGALNRMTNAWQRAKTQIAESVPVAGGMNTITGFLEEVMAAQARMRQSNDGVISQFAQLQAAMWKVYGVNTSAADSYVVLQQQISAANAELQRLQQAAKDNPGNIFIQQFIRDAQRLVEELKAAKQAKDELTAGQGTSQSQQFAAASSGIGALAKQGLEDQAKAQKALTDARNQALGVNAAFVKQLMELHQLRSAQFAQDGKGLITEKQYAEAVKNLTAATFKKTDATKKDNDEMADAVKLYKELERAGRDYMRGLAERGAVLQREIDLGRGLTQGEREQLELTQKLADGRLLLSEAAEAQARAQIDLQQQQREERAWVDERAKENRDALSALQAHTAGLQAQAEAQRKANDTAGLSERAIGQLEVAELRATAATRERTAAMYESVAPDIAEAYRKQAEALRALADEQERGIGVQAAKEAREEWKRTVDSISDGLSDALMRAFERGEGFAEAFRSTVVNAFKTMVLEPQVRAIVGGGGKWLGSLMGVAGAGGGSGGVGGGMGNLGSLGSMYNTAAGWFGGGSAAGGLGAVTGPQVYGSMAALGGITVSEGAAAATAGSTAGVSAIPIIGWIIAGLMASIEADKQGNNVDMLPDRMLVGDHERRKYGHLQKLGFSDKWANILSGSALVARTFGHKASSTGFGIGTVRDGDFLPGSASPMSFGANTLGTRTPDEWLQGMASDITASIGVTAGLFGGGLSEGMRFGALTDNDRKGKVAALMGFFGADDKLLAGTQTGSGAFGMGGPGGAASKIEGAELEKWFAEQMPVIIVQGLQQSDLADRFDAYFDAVAAKDLDAEKAAEMLQVATAVQQITDAMAHAGGVFTQFEQLAVPVFEKLAEGAGSFEALGQGIGSYYQNFYTAAERSQDAWDSITQALNDVGIQTIPRTRAGFKELVDGLDLTTEADRKAFVALMKVNGAFAQLTDASEQAAMQIADTKQGLQLELLRALGKEQDAVNLERQIELAKLRELERTLGVASGSFTTLKEQIYAAADAAIKVGPSATTRRLQSRIQDLQNPSAFVAEFMHAFKTGSTPTLRDRRDQYGSVEAMSGLLQRDTFGRYMDYRELMERMDQASAAQSERMQAQSAEGAQGWQQWRAEEQRRHDDELEATKSLVDQLRGLRETLSDYRSDLMQGDLSALSPEEQFRRARAEWEAASGVSDFSDPRALENLQRTSEAFLRISRSYEGHSAYSVSFQAVVDKLAAVEVQLAGLQRTGEKSLAVAAEAANTTIDAIRQGTSAQQRLVSVAEMEAQRRVS